ncbi:hypothetical protein WA588_005782 [Blastocystis sp. NMH]
MQHDDLIWQIINNEFCSFKAKLRMEKKAFCRNPYNVTGLCNRRNCPLANSRYATIREEKGKCYLCMKTIERAHSPKRLWEKIELPANKEQAMKVIDENLQYWPEFMINRSKERFLRIRQYLSRMRKLRLQTQPVYERIHRKTEKREAVREKKAESAAKLEKSIESELLERLKKGTYGDIYNFAPEEFNKVLDEEAESEKEIEDEDLFVEDMGEDEDMEELGDALPSKKGTKGGKPSSSAHVELEYEEEEENPQLEEN